MKQVNLMHMMLIGPSLYYVGHKEKENKDINYYLLAGLVLLIPFIVRLPKYKIDFRNIVNSVHYLMWIPLFGYIVYKKNNSPLMMYKILRLLGVAVIAIHAYLFSEKQKQ